LKQLTKTKPKSLSTEEYEMMEEVAKAFKSYNVRAIEHLLSDDGEYTIPGEKTSVGVSKEKFLIYFDLELEFFKPIFKDTLDHYYSVCNNCIFGHNILKFNKPFSRESGPFYPFGFRINLKEGKIATMELCFNDIENSERFRKQQENQKSSNINHTPVEYDENDYLTLPRHRGRAAGLLLDHLDDSKKYLLLEFYDRCKAELHKFNKRITNSKITGLFSNQAIDELFLNPSNIEEEKKKVLEILENRIDFEKRIKVENPINNFDFFDDDIPF